jgi:hypothetical protein
MLVESAKASPNKKKPLVRIHIVVLRPNLKLYKNYNLMLGLIEDRNEVHAKWVTFFTIDSAAE